MDELTRFTIRFTDEEAEKLHSQAEAAGYSLAAYIRRRLKLPATPSGRPGVWSSGRQKAPEPPQKASRRKKASKSTSHPKRRTAKA